MVVAELNIQQMVLNDPVSGLSLNLTLLLQSISLMMLAEVMKDVLLVPIHGFFIQYKNIMV